jgi:hypothetical protein
MGFYAKMKRICNNVRKHTRKTNLLGLDAIAVEVENLNTKLEPFFAKAVDVSGVSEMTDKTKIYRLNGTLWIYRAGESSVETVTEQIVGTTDNPWGAGRLSSGNPNGLSGYVTTPYIDLTKYDSPFTLHLGGIPFNYVNDNYRFSQYKTDKTHIATQQSKQATLAEWFKNSNVVVGNNNSLAITFTPPIINMNSADVAYARFSGQGTEEAANVYITYEKGKVVEPGWFDTGIGSGEITSSVPTVTQANDSVKSFMSTVTYSDTDYSYTSVTSYAASDGSRKDQPVPYTINWTSVANVVVYAVSVNGTTYYTDKNTLSISNLIPNSECTYAVYALCTNGTMTVVKSGKFTTSGYQTRLLNIDGIQNVRDVGGYSVGDHTVRYGLIYRGSAMDETTYPTTLITDAGKQELLSRVGVKTDLDLRGENNVTASILGDAVDFYAPQYSYQQYANAITESVHRGYFKDMLEYIVAQLTENKPVYIHCSGGCDRTGTLVFLILGLLGVSESDLAKEYELSSFSVIGQGRTRNSTVYDYKGMVAAIKEYDGATITDKFHTFATAGCGISSDVVEAFKGLMLK